MDTEINLNVLENKIDYRRFIEALDYYENLGYRYTNVDWTVDKDISGFTKPIDHEDFFIKDKVLVASAEQSFLQKIWDKNLPKGRYCAITPCFRDDENDMIHNNYFMKLELIETKNVNTVMLHSTVVDSFNFFKKYLPCKMVKQEDGSVDIVAIKDDWEWELGSYGIRNFGGDCNYIYGTGLAEPRFSKIIEICKSKKF